LARAIESRALVDVPVKVINMPGDASRRIWGYLDRFPGDPHVLVVTSPNVTTDYLTGQAAFDHDSYTPLAILHNEYIAFIGARGLDNRQQRSTHGTSGSRCGLAHGRHRNVGRQSESHCAGASGAQRGRQRGSAQGQSVRFGAQCN